MSTPPISLERYKNCVNAVFKALNDNPDGLTAYELEKLTGFPRSTIKFALMDNVLFYVDRWKVTRKVNQTQVWCVAEVKRYQDCPRPEEIE